MSETIREFEKWIEEKRAEAGILDEADDIPTVMECPACMCADPDIVEVDFGFGYYEYGSETGNHTDVRRVTKCCEVEPVEVPDFDTHNRSRDR